MDLYDYIAVQKGDRRMKAEYDSPHPSRDPWLRGEQYSQPVEVLSLFSCCSAQYFEAEHLSQSLEVRSSMAELAERDLRAPLSWAVRPHELCPSVRLCSLAESHLIVSIHNRGDTMRLEYLIHEMVVAWQIYLVVHAFDLRCYCWS